MVKIMSIYIENILQLKDKVQQEKKVQNTIVSLIVKYYKNPDDNTTLQHIKEVATYFNEQKINFSYQNDILLRISCSYGEKKFVEWLLKKANYKKVPDLLVETSKPLILAALNNHTELVEFLLLDKDIARSDINTVYGSLFSSIISQKNIKLVKLFLNQPQLNIKIEHIVGLYKYNNTDQDDVLEFISKHTVKDNFFKIMVQHKGSLHNEIYALLTKKYFSITEQVIETLKYSPEFNEIIEKRELLFKLEEKFPEKDNRSLTGRINKI